ncbi:twin-arginine translocase subunit TatC [Mechercharimyces sp. CAU 1602]|uniref:twin-arginine translocase subunit TatC n=1 Tax=Mechercharimyces sp. CAU 1602 TaxID=2973933 RepID=UPI002161C051|nr:twin-arginine translocase subunit TatC [Mechercharimyces sp. CAU 1602]MCS1352116.1 twin-arginine translocase subunit TatC [Mechercharimyces sp. CAU 1602]
MTEQNQTALDHFVELRSRILWVLGTFIVSMGLGIYLAGPIIQWFKKRPSLEGFSFHIFNPMDPLTVIMQFAFVIAFCLTLPVLLYQIWKFVKPGLLPHEQRATLVYIPIAVLLFALGLSFGLFIVFPYLIMFMETLNGVLGAEMTYGIYEVFSFMFRICFPMALLFELPIIVLFFTRLRILRPSMLRKGRRFAYVALVVVAAMITPPDFISNILVAIPLFLLYEISIALCAWLDRRLIRLDEERERMWEETKE